MPGSRGSQPKTGSLARGGDRRLDEVEVTLAGDAVENDPCEGELRVEALEAKNDGGETTRAL